ncbi:MAG TPA: dynamin family protein [Candidatus Acidoferrales bacterium]|nr:dynamin family protein [Candidatus Acidoferrales bacterium]
MNLEEYEGLKFRLGEIVRSAALRERAQSAQASPAIREIFARLAEDRFNLVVAGRFNRGKTSLMNALLSTNRLPVGILPLTSVVTTVSYGSDEIATIEYAHRSIPDRVPLDELARYITEEGNPGNVRGITTARVQFPAELLLRGFHFIDTPGVGSAIAENSRTTHAFLPEADAVLLVTSFESPLSEDEMQIVDVVRAHRRRMFFVVNKKDLAGDEEREAVVRYMREALRDAGIDDPEIFQVSCRQGCSEGTAELAEHLSDYLVKDKFEDFLGAMCERIASLLGSLEGVETERAELRTVTGLLGTSHAGGRSAPSRARDGTFESCSICDEATRAVVAFLSTYQYELIASSPARERLADAGGFCQMHTWQYDALAGSRGACIAISTVLSRVAERIREAAVQKDARASVQRFRDLRATQARCPACKIKTGAEQSALAAAIRDAADAAAAGAYCLAHFDRIVEGLPADVPALRLADSEANAIVRVAEDMQRFLLKFDGTRRDLLDAHERNADQRGLAILAGSRGMNGITAAR